MAAKLSKISKIILNFLRITSAIADYLLRAILLTHYYFTTEMLLCKGRKSYRNSTIALIERSGKYRGKCLQHASRYADECPLQKYMVVISPGFNYYDLPKSKQAEQNHDRRENN